MIMLYQVNKLKKSLSQDRAGVVIEIKDHKNIKMKKMILLMIIPINS